MEVRAITYWDGIVSPMFDAAASILIVASDGTREMADVSRMSVHEKTVFLKDKDVRVVICGAISGIAHTILADRGIRVLPWIRGPVDEVLRAYAAGTLDTEPYRMPGCQRRNRCRGRRRTGRRCATPF